jgi:hypothetical protein
MVDHAFVVVKDLHLGLGARGFVVGLDFASNSVDQIHTTAVVEAAWCSKAGVTAVEKCVPLSLSVAQPL